MKFLIYDNSGESFDRYTIFYRENGWQPWQNYIAASDHPFHPQGFGQHGETSPFYRRADMEHIGKPVRFNKLPADVQRFALMQ